MLFDEDRERERGPNPEEGLEPDVEPDPEADLPNYEEELPNIPEPPEPPEPDLDETEVPGQIAIAFWYLVVVFNAALLALGVGAMFALSGRDVELGLRLLAIGGILGIYGFYRYWTSPYRDGIPEDERVDPDRDRGEDDETAGDRSDDGPDGTPE